MTTTRDVNIGSGVQQRVEGVIDAVELNAVRETVDATADHGEVEDLAELRGDGLRHVRDVVGREAVLLESGGHVDASGKPSDMLRNLNLQLKEGILRDERDSEGTLQLREDLLRSGEAVAEDDCRVRGAAMRSWLEVKDSKLVDRLLEVML